MKEVDRIWRACAPVLSVGFLLSSCAEPTLAGCQSDDDCGDGELCDLISGVCISGEATGDEGEFDGDFTCEIGEDAETAPFSGSSSVVGLWSDVDLRLQDYDLCYLENGGDQLAIELHGTRTEDDESAHYILYMLMPISDIDGSADLDCDDGAPGEGEFSAVLYRAVIEGDVVVEDPVVVGTGAEGTLEIEGDGEVGAQLEGVLDVLID